MRYIDFSMQTLIAIAGIGFFIVTLSSSNWLITIYVIQLILGAWQFISAIVSVIKHSPYWRLKSAYLLLSLVYLLFLLMVKHPVATTSSVYTILFLTLPAWTLALVYYGITIKETFNRRRNRGGFLPNLSF
jgi:hypothetical protein